VLLEAGDSPLSSAFAIHLCARFLGVLRSLENAGTSHTDISAGNVVVHLDQPQVQLLDLEDMYLPGSPPPTKPRGGAPGYRHPAGESVFCPEGDRYAAAVLGAEILVLAQPEYAGLAGDTGFFGANVLDASGAERYAAVEGWLRDLAPRFADAFARAWHSNALRECPRVAELHDAIEEVARVTELPPVAATTPRTAAKRVHAVTPTPVRTPAQVRTPVPAPVSRAPRPSRTAKTPLPQSGKAIWSAASEAGGERTPVKVPPRNLPAAQITGTGWLWVSVLAAALALWPDMRLLMAGIAMVTGAVGYLWAKGRTQIRWGTAISAAAGAGLLLMALSDGPLPAAGSRTPTGVPHPVARPELSPKTPPASLSASAPELYVPNGYKVVGVPTLLEGPSVNDPYHRYRVPLRAEDSLFRIPVNALRLPLSSSAELREMAHFLVVDPRLLPGQSFADNAATLVAASGRTVDGTWRVRFQEGGGEWRVAEARPVEVADIAAGGSGERSSAILTATELQGVAAGRQSALAMYQARWDEVQRGVAAFRARALEQVPPRCSQSTQSLLNEVVRLTSYCPTVADEGARTTCFQHRAHLNSEFGSCDAVNQRHEEALARAERSTVAHRRERVAAFARQLEQEAASHQGH
jgi:hypothetical protein